jgi:hypothetical protein
MTKTNDMTGKTTWETPALRFVSRLDQLVQGGEGKVGDPGEPKKVENKG